MFYFAVYIIRNYMLPCPLHGLDALWLYTPSTSLYASNLAQTLN